MGILKKDKTTCIEKYSLKEMNLIEAHIDKYFGKLTYVNHEIESPDIHLDVCIIEPTPDRDYYTLITMGMGAHKMNVSKGFVKSKLNRAELIITLPSYWEFDTNEEKWFWPIRLIKELGRLPIHSNTWLGYSHTISNQSSYDKSTKLSGSYLSFPYEVRNDIKCFRKKIGMLKQINFYQVVPIYEEEMDYKLEKGVEEFEKLFPENFDMIVDPKRKNFAKGKK